MHFDTPSFAIDPGNMLELVKSKISSQFPVYTGQDIQIERRGDAKFIVICREQLRVRFFQVRSEQHGVSRHKNVAHFLQETLSRWTIEVSDGATQEKDQKMLFPPPVSRDFQQSIQIFTLATQDADRINVTQLAFAHRQRSRRDFNRIIRSPLATAQRLENPARLFAAAAAQFGHGNGQGQTVDDIASVPPQKPFISPRETIFRKNADHFKKRRAHVVVQILGEQFLLSRLSESGTHIRGKLVGGISGDRMRQHSSNLLERLATHTTESGINVLVVWLEPVAE